MNYKHTTSHNARIFYQDRGEGDPLVLIMGFGADGSAWNKHAIEYERHFRCIIPDNRGVGRSDQPPGPYSTAQMAADTIAVMDDANVDKACIAGISMGGAIAQELVLRYPERVKKLLLVSTWPAFDNYAKSIYQNLKIIRSQVAPKDFMELLQLWIYAPPYYNSHSELLKKDAMTYAANNNLQTQEGFEGQLDACISHDATDRLKSIDLPVLISVGMMDIFTPPVFSHLLKEKIRNSIISEYPTGGHVHHWEDIERFNNESLGFLLK